MNNEAPTVAFRGGDDISIGMEDIDLYTLFLHLMEKPSPGRESMLMDERVKSVLAEVAGELGVTGLVELPDSMQEAESRYLSLFEVGVPSPPCPLNESPYNRKDPLTKVIHENLLFYRMFGLDLNSENRELPDHMISQLEFLSFLTRLVEQASDEGALKAVKAAKRDFIERHMLSWIPKARTKLCELEDPLYGPIFCILEAYLRADLSSLN